jgi:hypothetical protein
MSKAIITDVIKEKLTGEVQKHTLDFIFFMQENGFSFEGFDAGDEGFRWTPVYNGKGLGCVAITDCFMFWVGLDWCFKDNGTVDNEMKSFINTHVVICPQEQYCKPPYCEGSKNHWQIFNDEYKSTCHSPLAFFSPDINTFELMKKLFLLTK